MKKNNLFKISLLLLVLNFTIIRSDELEACRDGVKNRNWQNGVPLIIDSSQISGNRTPVNTIREKAAWIFGYNSNIGNSSFDNTRSADGTSYTYGNGCDVGTLFNPQAPSYWGGFSCSGCADNRFCLGGIDVCDYGSSIGWALNDDGSNTLNFYRNDGFNWPNYLLFFMWGRRFKSHIWGDGTRNMLQLIYLSYTGQKPGTGGFSNPGVLSSGYSNGYPNATNSINNTEADGIKCINPNNTYGDGSGNGGNGCDQG